MPFDWFGTIWLQKGPSKKICVVGINSLHFKQKPSVFSLKGSSFLCLKNENKNGIHFRVTVGNRWHSEFVGNFPSDLFLWIFLELIYFSLILELLENTQLISCKVQITFSFYPWFSTLYVLLVVPSRALKRNGYPGSNPAAAPFHEASESVFMVETGNLYILKILPMILMAQQGWDTGSYYSYISMSYIYWMILCY